MAKIEVVMFERDRHGNKTGKRLTFKTNNVAWLADRCEREAIKGTKKPKRPQAIDSFYDVPCVA